MNNPHNTYHQYSRWATFFVAADSICVTLQISEQFFFESQNDNPLDAEPEPDFNAKWLFRVIQGHPHNSRSMSVQLIQGRWFWYQSKARVRFPISVQ